VSTNAEAIRKKIGALRELEAERQKREQEASMAAYANTIRDRGSIPQIIIFDDDADKDKQREQLLAALDHPEFYVERLIISPPEQKEEPLPKAYVEDNVRRFESQPPVTPTPTIPGPPSRPRHLAVEVVLPASPDLSMRARSGAIRLF